MQTRGKTNTKRGGENYRGDIAGFEANSETIQSPLHLDKMFPRVVSSWWGTDILNSLKSIKYMFQFSVSMVSFVPILYLLVEVMWPTQDRDMDSREGLHHWWWWLESSDPVNYSDLSLNVTVTTVCLGFQMFPQLMVGSDEDERMDWNRIT